MRAVDWLRFLTQQNREHRKSLFTRTELANVQGASPAVIDVTLGRLVRQGVIRRYAPGRYGLPEAVAAEELVATLDPHAYATAAYALFRHGHVTQVPREIDCFTRRRHNRSRRRETPLGTLVFVCVGEALHDRPAGALAGPAQALFDLVFLLRRRGLEPRSLFTFRRLETISFPDELIARYPRTVGESVARLLQAGEASD